MLTQKQNNYALNLFKGMSQREAYREAGYSVNYALTAVDVNACKLAKNTKITLRLEELREASNDAAVMDFTRRQIKLSEIGEEDITSDKGTPIRTPNIAAIAELNKMDGVYEGNTININDIKILVVYDDVIKE